MWTCASPVSSQNCNSIIITYVEVMLLIVVKAVEFTSVNGLVHVGG